MSYLFLLKYGNVVVLEEVSLENVPGSVVKPTVKFLALEIPVTVNNLLNEEFAIPVRFTVLLTLRTST